jgi:hypothetical protein
MSGTTGVMIAAAVAAVALVRIEWRRPGRLRRSRALAAAAAVGCLLLIALRPSRVASLGTVTATIVTRGAVSPGDGHGPAYDLGVTVPRATSVPDLGWVARHRPVPAVLRIVGWGLDEEQWPNDLGAPLPFGVEAVLAPPPAGIVSITWPGSLTLGEEAVVRGRVRAGAAPTRIILADASGPLDSVRGSGQEFAFTLRARPRATGEWRPTLSLDPARGVASESLAIDVRPAPPFRVLLVESSPSFDTRFLRDWLAGQGATVETRARVGRGRSRITAVNAPARDRLSDTVLGAADVVVLRGAPGAALARDERAALDRAVRERGLGLVVVVADTASVAARFGSEVLIRDTSGAPTAVVEPAGSGMVARTSVANSAAWRLRGDSTGYGAFWARVLGAVRRPSDGVIAIAGSGPHFTGRPTAVVARAVAPVHAVTVERAGDPMDTVFLAPTSGDSATRRGVFWPRAPGWYRFGGSAGAGLFVYDTARWVALQARQRNEATLARIGPGSGSSADGVREPVPLWPAYLGFLVAAGILWWAQMGMRLSRALTVPTVAPAD